MNRRSPITDSPTERLKEISTWIYFVLNLYELPVLIIEKASRMMQAKASSLLLLDQKTRRLY